MSSGWNLKEPPIEIKHTDLERVSEDSSYRSWCPKCNKGVLLVSRPLHVFKLNRTERCTLCGQPFWYTDETVNGESFVEDQPRHLTPEVLAAFKKLSDTLPSMPLPNQLNFWETLRKYIEAPED